MESNNKLKSIDDKNRTSCYFDDVIEIDLGTISIEGKSNETVSVYNFSYKRLVDYIPLWIRLIKIGRFIRVHDWTRYFSLREITFWGLREVAPTWSSV